METFRSLRESGKITIYAGVNHFNYQNPVITTDQEEVEDMEYQDSVKVDSPKDWIGCYYNNEHISIFKAESPSKAKKWWKQQIEEQMTDDLDEFEIETEFGTYFLSKDVTSIEKGLNYIKDAIMESEADGDSAYGIIWRPVKDLISTAEEHPRKQNLRALKNLPNYLNKETGRYDYLNREFTPRDLIKDGKFIVPIGIWEGDFNCIKSNLTSLQGAPEVVGGDFNCYDNQLTTLEGAPREVSRDFNCVGNQLTSLEGAPEKVGRSFYCGLNQLTTLEGAPSEVGESFECDNNKLTSLKGAPSEVEGHFSCSNNKLTSLKGAPKRVGSGFNCEKNPLTSLEGKPEYTGGWFYK